jgi:hypothetical protein
MKALRTCLLILTLVGSIQQSGIAQSNDRIYLQSGTISTSRNVEAFVQNPGPLESTGGYYFRYLQFSKLPDVSQRELLRSGGLVLGSYLPERTFIAAIPVNYNRSLLIQAGVQAVITPAASWKISKVISTGYPDWCVKVQGEADLQVQYYAGLAPEEIIKEAGRYGRVLTISPEQQTITIRIRQQDLQQFAAEPWVMFADAIAAPDVPDDTRGRSLHRSNTINNDFVTGRRYDGSGVNVAIADDGFVGPHIDFQGRITNFATGTGQSHGDMCSGICVGAGNLNPTMRGMATGAYLYTYNISGYPQIVNSVANFNTYGIVISSTSYSQGCNQYTSDTQFGDNLLYNNSHLQAVYSGGNNQSGNCSYGAGAGWGNITGGYKQGKNVIACGNLTALEVLDGTSSRGPASDGRIKPDICANGNSQNSTNENNTYQVGGGTSAASPGIAGIFAQLYQAYKQLFGSTLAPAPLLKACMLNSAEDIGNPGPDYTFGWGRVNAFRALTTLEQNRFLTDSVTQGNTKTHGIVVPAGTRQLRVMVYWADPGGTPLAAKSLVNNLNMQVSDPSLVNWNPWVLDPTPVVANLTTPAVRAVDTLNNVEQVTIDNPAAGNYTVTVNGFSVPSIGQRYYLVWEFRGDAVTITYPNGGEGFVPGETEVIRWDGPRDAGTYDLAYSTNNGSSWTNISTGIAQNIQQFSWTVPSLTSGAVRLRITRGAFNDQSDTALAIIGVPTGLAVSYGCPDSIRITWNAVSGAAGYTVYRLGNQIMEPIGTTTATSFVITGTNPNIEYWFSVCANTTQGNRGRRANAIRKAPGLFSCPLPLDARIAAITSPAGGLLSACQNNSAVPITVTIENMGQNSIGNFPVSYQLNNGTVVTQTFTGPLATGATASFTFSGSINLSASGTYTLRAWTALPGDNNLFNDSSVVTTTSFGIVNAPITENFENATFAPSGWNIDNGGGGTTWVRRTTITGSNGVSTSAAWMDNYSYNSPGTEDRLASYTVYLTGAGSARMTFDVAYARYSTVYTDGLRVDVSTDCGQTWQPSGYLKSDLVLATAGTLTNSWVPTSASQWRRDTVDLSAWAGNNVTVRFVNINGYGNNLYLDNVNFSVTAAAPQLTLTVLLEGFHSGGGNMTPAMFNAGVSSNPLAVDSITIELRNPTAPYALVATRTALLTTNGQCSFSLPPALNQNSYYLVIRGRNIITTWSKNPVLIGPSSTYNFRN